MATTTTTTGNTAPMQPHYPEQVTGMDILVRALRMVGIDTMYGLVGIPITELAYLAQERGIRFVGFRHEQQAGMAAATHGYLTHTPGVLYGVVARIHERPYRNGQRHSELLSHDSDKRFECAGTYRPRTRYL